MKKADWWSVAYALAEGASSLLSIRRDDIDVTVRIAPEGGYSVFLTDSVPGGAGHVVRVHQHITGVAHKALERVASCTCEETTSCYECLRTFGNQRMHGQLSRGAASRFLLSALEGRRIPARRVGAIDGDLDVLSLIHDEPLREALRRCIGSGLPVPEVGYEVADECGEVMCELEAAWPDRRFGIVVDGQAMSADGWTVVRSVDVVAAPEDLLSALMSADVMVSRAIPAGRS